MISVKSADKIIQQNIISLKSAKDHLLSCLDTTLDEDIICDRDQPPFDRVTMDGIAVAFEDIKRGVYIFQKSATAYAGQPGMNRPQQGHCLEVMTGAILPKGCDTVIPKEYFKEKCGIMTVHKSYRPKKHDFIHRQASDAKKGTVVLKKEAYINAAVLSILAGIGKMQVRVKKPLQIGIVSTGDECIAPNLRPKLYQIRQTHALCLTAALHQHRFAHVESQHIPDDMALMRKIIKEQLTKQNVLILTGGVSKGKKDYVPEVLKSLRVNTLFHFIQQRPGKPMLFGLYKNNKAIFALPGNPVSVQMTFFRYVLPYLKTARGEPKACSMKTTLNKSMPPHPAFTQFIPVTIKQDRKNNLSATPILFDFSGNHLSLAQSTGFVEIPPNHNKQPKQIFTYQSWI